MPASTLPAMVAHYDAVAVTTGRKRGPCMMAADVSGRVQRSREMVEPGPGDMRRVSVLAIVRRGQRRFPSVDAVSAVGPVQELLNHCEQVRYG